MRFSPKTDENGFLIFDPDGDDGGASAGELRAYRSGRASLSYSDSTERALRRKLRSKGFSVPETDYAIGRLKEEQLIDDRAYAERCFAYLVYEKRYGARRVRNELYSKGVGPEIIASLPFDEADFSENCGYHLSLLGGAVTAADGRNVDHEFRAGARAGLALARMFRPDLVILKSRSPSCGAGEIYDGSFSHTRVPGDGVFAALLKEEGFRVITDEEALRVLSESLLPDAESSLRKACHD